MGTGLSFNTPSISVTTTFYADAGIGCNSARVSVQAVVNPIPAAPVAVSGNRMWYRTVTLIATSPEQIYWYSTASGGVLLGTGNSFTTPSIKQFLQTIMLKQETIAEATGYLFKL